MVEEDDQFTHMIRLDGEYKEEMMLNVFKKDDDFLKNEKQYEDIKKEILGESDDSDSDSSGMAQFLTKVIFRFFSHTKGLLPINFNKPMTSNFWIL